jgi:eukaryotic-like serine/threonine-protein kinase
MFHKPAAIAGGSAVASVSRAAQVLDYHRHMDRSDDASADTALDTESPRSPGESPAKVTGYTLGETLGRGGMGEVVLAHDARLDRDVALKRMRPDAVTPETLERFLREVRVQARLDHPCIVPVHEIGYDAMGQPYFTMKRLTGTTLAEVLARGDAKLQRLLRAFVDVCQAIELAHERRIVHRDLKPANIMLGNYGEVYVLDWGVARILANVTTLAGKEDLTTDATQVGSVIGTPAYMAPEQKRGEPSGPAADVYSLGAILFEILAGEPLHRGEQVSPALRRPDRAVPPELDALCISALASAPLARPPAGVVAARVQEYLDGDRDLERRRALAAEQVALARRAAAAGGPDARATAIRHAGRALGLDAEASGAAELLSSLLVEPPSVLPPALVDHLERSERVHTRVRARYGAVAQGVGFSLFASVPLFAGVEDWRWLLAIYASAVLVLVQIVVLARRGVVHPVVPLAAVLVLSIVWSRVAGPFVVVPVMLGGAFVGVSANPTLQRHPRIYLASCLAIVLAPFALEWLNVLSPSWSVGNGVFNARSSVLVLDGTGAEIALMLANILSIMSLAMFAWALNRGARASRETLDVQKWQLEQLLPRA